jgi:hypothetical protein
MRIGGEVLKKMAENFELEKYDQCLPHKLRFFILANYFLR